ncbi:MAG: M48 family metallopeptidase [Betaproteobacteria bacterium]|nr:M48 family metallopeptidase [Betaproteobacteria bacterium]
MPPTAHRLCIGLLLCVLALLGGCATNPMTGRSQLILVSEQSTISTATSAYASMMSTLDQKGAMSSDAALIARVQSITDRLVTQAVRYRPDTEHWAWSVKVIEDPKTLNAFCMPGGKMAIYTGLIHQLDVTDDELAQVMGHEISHAIANHGAEKMSNQLLANIVVAGIAAAARTSQDRQKRQDVGTAAALVFINLPNSRTAEEEADRLGIELAARAGYDPRAAITLWEKMMRQSGGNSRVDFLSTHPAPPKRIEALEELQAPMLKLYAQSQRELDASRKWTSTAANETEVPDAETENPVEPVASRLSDNQSPAGQPLAFYSKDFEQFKSGDAELSCSVPCALSFFLKQGTLREQYAKGAWRALAMETLKTDYRLDLAYFYLGMAAAALGFKDAGKKYLNLAIAASASKESSCADGILVRCGELDIRTAAQTALAQM